MKFEELSQELQENFLKLYKEHLKTSIDILNEDHWLEPILRINNQTEPTLVALQREEDTVDFDKMMEVAKDILRSHPFDTALLSYSTDVVLKDTSALVTYIIDKSGVGVLYFTAYHFKGLFRKKSRLRQASYRRNYQKRPVKTVRQGLSVAQRYTLLT